MVWVKTTDDMPENRKIRSLSPTAACLYFFGIHRCNAWLTDGRIAREQVVEIFRPFGKKLRLKGAVAELVKQNLWEVTEDGYRVHDYDQYQPSAEDVAREREQSRHRGARKRARDRDAKLAQKRQISVRATEQLDAQTEGSKQPITTVTTDSGHPLRRYARTQPVPVPDQEGDPRARSAAPPAPRSTAKPLSSPTTAGVGAQAAGPPGEGIPSPSPEVDRRALAAAEIVARPVRSAALASRLGPVHAQEGALEPRGGALTRSPICPPTLGLARATGGVAAQRVASQPNPATAPVGGIQPPIREPGDDNVLDSHDAVATVCGAAPALFPLPHNLKSTWSERIRSLAGHVTRWDIKLALFQCRLRTVGSVMPGGGAKPFGMGLMLQMLEPAVALRVNHEANERARHLAAEIAMETRHQERRDAFTAENGDVDWIKLAIEKGAC